MKWLKRVHLIDKCLLVFMTIFMIQSGYTLFTQYTAETQDINSIDVIVRTSAAAIFGYFISSNFVRRDSLKDAPTSGGSLQSPEIKEITTAKESQISQEPQEVGRIKNQIGFAAPNPSPKAELQDGKGEVLETEEERTTIAAELQIVIISVIGITSLCILLIYRDFFEMTAASVGSLSQLRDFVSGCVGFLIGSTTGKSGN